MKILQFLIFIFISNIIMAQASKSRSQEWMTIFIHGTVGLKSNLSLDTIAHLIGDNIEGSDYERNILSARENPYFFTMQPMQKLGLRRVFANCSSPCGPYAFATFFDFMLKRYGHSYEKNVYYTFGWSGLLSYKRRYYEAIILYNQLREELKRLALKGHKPKIRIVAYSHGGNLALNLAMLRQYCYPQDKFNIDELIVIGMPVQYINSSYAHHPMFKRIYNIYSTADLVQCLDLFAPCNLVSHRRFHGCLPAKLTQIEIRVTAKLLNNISVNLPQGLRGTINQSPGHLELWFFGWVPEEYRRNFVFYPLPVAAFIPFIIQAAHSHPACSDHVIVDLWPDQEVAIVTPKKYDLKAIIPFMTRQELINLQWKAMSFHPSNPKYKNNFLRLKANAPSNTYK